jgi:hypothetical protein
MRKFDVNKYANVAERLAKFHEDHPDGRIITEWENSFEEVSGVRTWVVRTTIYLDAGDQANKLAKSTGLAFEIDGTGGANNGSALENAETSSVGRALMLAGYAVSKNGELASAQEMDKVNRILATDWIAEAQEILNVQDLRSLYTRAKSQGANAEVLEQLKDYANALNTSSEDSGSNGSVPRGAGKR